MIDAVASNKILQYHTHAALILVTMKEMQTKDSASTVPRYRKNRQLTPLSLKFSLSKQPSFSAPFSRQQKILFAIQKKIVIILGLQDVLIYEKNYREPLLHLVLNYLHDKKLVKEPRIIFEERYHDLPNLPIAKIVCNPAHLVTDGIVFKKLTGESIDTDPYQASIKAVGELLERIFLSTYKNNRLLTASIATLKQTKKSFVHPDSIAGFSEQQKERNTRLRFDETTPFRWVHTTSLHSGKKTWVPAQSVFWNYEPHSEEAILEHPTSNGGGGHPVAEQAIVNGLLEIIERDGFLLHWLTGTAPPQVATSSLRDPDTVELLALFERYRLKVTIFNTTTDVRIPSFACALFDDSGVGPMVSFGGSANLDPEQAIYKSILESYNLHSWLRKRMETEQFTLPFDYTPFTKPIGRKERLLLWADNVMRDELEFFMTGQTLPLSDHNFTSAPKEVPPASQLSIILENLKSLDHEALVYHTTSSQLQRLRYHVVKVIVPHLLPLYLKEGLAPLGSARLQNFKHKHGVKTFSPQPFPHPFP